MSLATSEKYKDSAGNQQEQTEWHSLVIWKKLAEIANEYVRKGSQLYIEGKITYRKWETKDGEKRNSTEIVVLHMKILGGFNKKEENAVEKKTAAPRSVATQPEQNEGGKEEDLPF